MGFCTASNLTHIGVCLFYRVCKICERPASSSLIASKDLAIRNRSSDVSGPIGCRLDMQLIVFEFSEKLIVYHILLGRLDKVRPGQLG